MEGRWGRCVMGCVCVLWWGIQRICCVTIGSDKGTVGRREPRSACTSAGVIHRSGSRGVGSRRPRRRGWDLGERIKATQAGVWRPLWFGKSSTSRTQPATKTMLRVHGSKSGEGEPWASQMHPEITAGALHGPRSDPTSANGTRETIGPLWSRWAKIREDIANDWQQCQD